MTWIKHFLFLLVGLIGGAIAHSFYIEAEPTKGDLEAAGIAQAREISRVQFERDIGFAEAQLAGARSALKSLTDKPESGSLSADEMNTQGQDLQAAKESVKQKQERVAFLRNEAKRLSIPVAPPSENESVQVASSEQEVEEDYAVPTPPPLAVPNLITLTEPVEVKDPATTEVYRFGRGRTFRPLGVSNEAIRVRYLEKEISIPIASTDVNLKF